MTKEIAINKFRFPPEISFITDGEDLASGAKNLFRLKQLNRAQQIVLPLSYAAEKIDDILIGHIFDSTEEPLLDGGSLNGIDAVDNKIAAENPYAFIYNEYRMNAQNNSGGASADYRSRLSYMIHPNTTVRKLANQQTLTKRDLDAMRILNEKGIVDTTKVFNIGFRQPMNFTEGLNDRNKKAIQRALVPNITLGSTRTQLIRHDVTPGDCGVLKSLIVEKPPQAQVGEATVHISRDDDPDLIEFDPACIQGSAIEIPFHIPAYDEIIVELSSNTANQANYKAWVGIQTKVVGLFTKARLQEFSDTSFPVEITVSEREQQEIDTLSLKELNRVGLML